VTLLIQCLLPALIKADSPVNLEVYGGTDVQWSPTVDYFRHVFLPALNCFGAKARLDTNQRGYYPKGMGSVLLRVYPGDLKMAHLNAQNGKIIEGISHCSNLPEHVAKRHAETATRILDAAGFDSRIDFQLINFPSTGSGITLWSGFKGGSALGKKGISAEDVGKRAANEIIKEMRSTAVVDIHLADQLILYLALAGGSFTTSEISMHTRTNIWTAKHFLEKEIEISCKDIFRVEAY
jgi:RNA 3'-terminal phosphate cyclase (ATP)